MKIVSLGTNCEASFRIEDYTCHPLDAYIFSWTETHDPLKQLEALKDLHSLKESSWHPNEYKLAVNEKYDIAFHFKNLPGDLLDEHGKLNKEVYEAGLSELKSRMAHLIDKTEKLFENLVGDDILFVYKAEMNEASQETPKYVTKVVKNLYKIVKNKLKNGNFFLMVTVANEKLFKYLTKHIRKPNLCFYLLSFFPPHYQRNLESDKKTWNRAFHSAFSKFEEYKFRKTHGFFKFILNKIRHPESLFNNLIAGLDSEHWKVIKNGDAVGSFDPKTGTIKCESSSTSYFGIKYDINPHNILGESLKITLKISEINSERIGVGYLQIWENYEDNPENTVSACLFNLSHDSEYYEIIYKVPQNLKKLSLVVQAKNGSFKINEVSLKNTVLN